jgi:RNA polymerase sigma-70 factor (ECF subfamily)
MVDTKEYNSAVREYTRNIYRYVFKSLKDKEATNDIVQDCFLKLWKEREKVDKLKVKYWLFATAHNTMINYLKKSSKTVSIDSILFEQPLATQKSDFDVKEILEKSLDTLPPIQKTIILLRDLEGYNYKEIGEILSLTEAQVKVYLFRARQKIKDLLKHLHAVI